MDTRHLGVALLVTLAVITGHPAVGTAQDRLPPIPDDKLTAEQLKALAEFRATRNNPNVPASFTPLLRSPEAMTRVGALGEYLRFRSALPPNLSEFVILVTARQMDQPYIWDVHYPIAREAGVSEEMLLSLAAGRRPERMTEDQASLFELIDEQYRTHRVTDATWGRALSRFGEKAVVDALAINGYYTLLAIVMNAAQTPSAGGAPPLQRLPR